MAAGSACSEEDIEDTVDCGQICARYDECIADIDATECSTNCEDLLASSADVERRAGLCEECLDGASCLEAEPCWDDCPVVPAVN